MEQEFSITVGEATLAINLALRPLRSTKHFEQMLAVLVQLEADEIPGWCNFFGCSAVLNAANAPDQSIAFVPEIYNNDSPILVGSLDKKVVPTEVMDQLAIFGSERTDAPVVHINVSDTISSDLTSLKSLYSRDVLNTYGRHLYKERLLSLTNAKVIKPNAKVGNVLVSSSVVARVTWLMENVGLKLLDTGSLSAQKSSTSWRSEERILSSGIASFPDLDSYLRRSLCDRYVHFISVVFEKELANVWKIFYSESIVPYVSDPSLSTLDTCWTTSFMEGDFYLTDVPKAPPYSYATCLSPDALGSCRNLINDILLRKKVPATDIIGPTILDAHSKYEGMNKLSFVVNSISEQMRLARVGDPANDLASKRACGLVPEDYEHNYAFGASLGKCKFKKIYIFSANEGAVASALRPWMATNARIYVLDKGEDPNELIDLAIRWSVELEVYDPQNVKDPTPDDLLVADDYVLQEYSRNKTWSVAYSDTYDNPVQMHDLYYIKRALGFPKPIRTVLRSPICFDLMSMKRVFASLMRSGSRVDVRTSPHPHEPIWSLHSDPFATDRMVPDDSSLGYFSLTSIVWATANCLLGSVRRHHVFLSDDKKAMGVMRQQQFANYSNRPIASMVYDDDFDVPPATKRVVLLSGELFERRKRFVAANKKARDAHREREKSRASDFEALGAAPLMMAY